MATLALYRTMHTVRGGPAKPAKTFALADDEALALREAGYVDAKAWALDSLSIVLEELGARLYLLRADAIQAVCRAHRLAALPEPLRGEVEERLVAQPLVRALRILQEAGREAMHQRMTLTYAPDS